MLHNQAAERQRRPCDGPAIAERARRRQRGLSKRRCPCAFACEAGKPRRRVQYARSSRCLQRRLVFEQAVEPENGLERLGTAEPEVGERREYVMHPLELGMSHQPCEGDAEVLDVVVDHVHCVPPLIATRSQHRREGGRALSKVFGVATPNLARALGRVQALARVLAKRLQHRKARLAIDGPLPDQTLVQ